MALYQRNRCGHGQCIDASLYGAQLYLAAPQLQSYLAGNGDRALQHSRRAAPNPLWNLYPTRGKWVYVCEPNEDARFRLLCAALGDGKLIGDPRFATAAARVANNVDLIAEFETLSAGLDHDTLLTRCAEHGVVAAPVNTLADVIKDPQAWDNDYLMKAYCEEVRREVDVRGLPVALSKTFSSTWPRICTRSSARSRRPRGDPSPLGEGLSRTRLPATRFEPDTALAGVR